MEHPDSKEIAGEKNVSSTAINAESPASANKNVTPREATPPRPWPNTAIERQIARAAALRYRQRTHQQVAIPIAAPRKTRSDADLCKYPRFGLKSFLVFFLFVAAGLTWVFNDGRLRQHTASAVPPIVGQTLASAAQTTAPKNVVGVSSGELSIPIADVSLRTQPDLLGQLVQFYRSRIPNDPSDSALTALNQLREQSLSELEISIAQGDNSAAGKSLQLISRFFPELADNPRYKYLAKRMQYSHRQATDEMAAKAEPLTPLATIIPPEISISAIPPEISVSDASPEIAALALLDSSANNAKPRSMGKQTKKSTMSEKNKKRDEAKKAVENAVPLKPEIDAVSITQGRMIRDRFTPNDDGNVLMVEISYRNFDKVSEDQSRATLVTRLGIPEDPMVFAEVPVAIFSDRGTKGFLVETLMPGHTVKKYQLNFHLNGEFLASRMVRLSEPGH